LAKGDVLVLELAVASLKQYMRINVNIKKKSKPLSLQALDRGRGVASLKTLCENKFSCKKNLKISVYTPFMGGEWGRKTLTF
jgi:hypothetical protein